MLQAELKRLRAAWGYSMAGFRFAYNEKGAFRSEVWLAAGMIPLAFFVHPWPMVRAALIASVLLVLAVELLNSSMEKTIDRFSREEHPLAKAAKDMGSAAVLVSLLIVAVVWGLALFG